MNKNESGFAGGVLGFYVGVMLGLALFRFPLPHGAFAEAAAGSSPYARMFGGIPGFEIGPTEKRLEAQRVATPARESSRGDRTATASARVAPRGALGD